METETKLLNFKDKKIQVISLNQLKSTVKEEDYNGKPLMGMYHYEFIERAVEVIDNSGLEYNIESIWAAQNQDKSRPGVSVIEKYREDYGENSIESFLMRRIFSKIIITSLGDQMTNTSIALSYNQLGFQLAYGPNVLMCENQCILGADKFMSTYAHENKMPNPGRMLEVLSDWLSNFKEIRENEQRIIKELSDVVVSENEAHEMIGEMIVKRVRKENGKLYPKEPANPLNQSQIGKFTQSWMFDRAENPEKILSAWDMYNFATELYKPGTTDMPLILSSNSAMSQYLMDRYNLN